MSNTPMGPGWYQASDGRWYPPQQMAPYPAPAKKSVNPWMIIGWIVLIAMCVPCVGCGALAGLAALGSSTTTTTSTTVPVAVTTTLPAGDVGR